LEREDIQRLSESLPYEERRIEIGFATKNTRTLSLPLLSLSLSHARILYLGDGSPAKPIFVNDDPLRDKTSAMSEEKKDSKKVHVQNDRSL
jgi:hypothetical protein